MPPASLKGVRTQQVLALLREHGPLSLGTIRELVQPPMSARRARELAARLLGQGLIFPVAGARGIGNGAVYEISRSREARSKIAVLLGIPADEIGFAFTRGREVRHGEITAVWAEFFRREFPDAKLVRDWEIQGDSRLPRMMLARGEGRDLYPDFVIQFPKAPGLEPVLLGVEIERTRKKFSRLVSKMRSLVMSTQLDGVLYVCDEVALAETIRRAMQTSKMRKSRRVGRYLDSFLCFATFAEMPKSRAMPVATLGLRVIPLDRWVHKLRTKPAHLRINSWFEEPAVGGWLGPPVRGEAGRSIGKEKQAHGEHRPPPSSPLALPDPTPSTSIDGNGWGQGDGDLGGGREGNF